MTNNICNTLFIYPTDTVWGIGGNIFSHEAYKHLLQVKKIEGERPFSILFSSIDNIYEYFDLPKKLSVDWYEKFFTYESTLLLNKNLIIRDIPIRVIGEEFVSIRLLKFKEIKRLMQDAHGPVITTSFNIQGMPPLTLLEDVEKLMASIGQDVNNSFNWELVNICDATLSGYSSTIVALSRDGFVIKREGRHIDKLREFCGL